MAQEISLDQMSPEARFMILENFTNQQRFSGRDPLEIILELEQLAAEEGFDNIHDFINYHMEGN